MCCIDLYRAVILQAFKDAAIPIPARKPEQPPPGYVPRICRDSPTPESAWKRIRKDNETKRNEALDARDTAREWLTSYSEDFIAVCLHAEVDPADVHSRAVALQAQGWPDEIAHISRAA